MAAHWLFLVLQVLSLVLFVAVILAIGWVFVWFLTPVAYKRWRQAAARDEARDAQP
jgi:hypothetical protein